MERSCVECVRLWRKYADATTAHIRLGGRLQIASLARNTTAMSELAKRTRRAFQLRQTARQAIADHEAVAHPPAAAKATAGG